MVSGANDLRCGSSPGGRLGFGTGIGIGLSGLIGGWGRLVTSGTVISSRHMVFRRYNTAPATFASIRNGLLRMSAYCSPIWLYLRGQWRSLALSFVASDERR